MIDASNIVTIFLLGISILLGILVLILWSRLRKAQGQITKLTWELRSARGEAHMRELEQQWSVSRSQH